MCLSLPRGKQSLGRIMKPNLLAVAREAYYYSYMFIIVDHLETRVDDYAPQSLPISRDLWGPFSSSVGTEHGVSQSLTDDCLPVIGPRVWLSGN